MVQEHLEDFNSFLKDRNFNISEIILDGDVHRFDAEKPLSGWYVGNTVKGDKGITHTYAVVSDWCVGEIHKFNSSTKLSRADNRNIKFLISNAATKAQKEKEKRQLEVAQKAQAIWQNSKADGPVHNYLQKNFLW